MKWNGQKIKPKGYWTYENTYAEAKKYKSRGEFYYMHPSAYYHALRSGWMDDYTWFVVKKRPSGYWDYETTRNEAKKYKSGGEFKKGHSSAYQAACRNGWLREFFPRNT